MLPIYTCHASKSVQHLRLLRAVIRSHPPDRGLRATAHAFVSSASRAGISALALLLVAVLSACSPRFDWRDVAPPDSGCSVALPGKPQTTRRDVELAGVLVPMAMTSTGVGATLFAVGVARLPASLARDTAAIQRALDYLSDTLVRNVGGTRQSLPAPTLSAHSLLGHEVRASVALQTLAAAATGPRTGTATAENRKDGNGVHAAQLYARLLLVDDRLYQLVAIGAPADLPAQAIETFFTSFRLTE